MDINKEMITITREYYNKLVDQTYWLQCLEAAGIDNTDAYDVAQDMYNGEEE